MITVENTEPIAIKNTIRYRKTNENAIVPTRGSEEAAGYDLYACIDEDIHILPKRTELIGVGIAMEIPKGFFGGIYARSGLALKEGLRPANCVGVVDSDYRNEIKVALHNDTDQIRVIKSGERIAQLVVQPYFAYELSETDDLSDTERGLNGFGSTGKF